MRFVFVSISLVNIGKMKFETIYLRSMLKYRRPERVKKCILLFLNLVAK